MGAVGVAHMIWPDKNGQNRTLSGHVRLCFLGHKSGQTRTSPFRGCPVLSGVRSTGQTDKAAAHTGPGGLGERERLGEVEILKS
jgi:hypothetical protein